MDIFDLTFKVDNPLGAKKTGYTGLLRIWHWYHPRTWHYGTWVIRGLMLVEDYSIS